MPPKKKAASASDGVDPAATTLPLTRELGIFEKTSKTITPIGVDEAGRGPLAGPLVCAAVAVLDLLKPAPVVGVRDSKQVEEDEREALFDKLVDAERTGLLVYGVSVIERERIDEINIFQATMEGMTASVAQVQDKLSKLADKKKLPAYVFIDGPKVPPQICDKVDEWLDAENKPASCLAIQGAEGVIGGDAKVYSIAAASLIAKVTRDRLMRELAVKYPLYGFEVHKGYGVPAHVAAIHKHGPSPVHRLSFNPVKTMVGFQYPDKAGKADNVGSSSSSSSGGVKAKSAAAGGKRARPASSSKAGAEAEEEQVVVPPAAAAEAQAGKGGEAKKRARRGSAVVADGADESAAAGSGAGAAPTAASGARTTRASARAAGKAK